MKKVELVSFLNQIGASPRKSLSQNFLIDQNIIDKVIQLAEIVPGDTVLEIGSGPGAITSQVLDKGAHVIAVEKDKLFAKHLPSHPNLRVYCEDILQFPFKTLPPLQKIVSNIPFHITAPILEKICAHSDLFQSFTLIIQKEVAEKINAKPKTKQFGSLNLLLQFYWNVKGSFPVAGSCFYPAPKVESTAIRFDPKPRPPIEPAHFFSIVEKAFGQRRKMIASSLKSLNIDIGKLLESCNLSPKARPQELSLVDWVLFIEKIDSISL